jgi:hypothetical protein
MKSKPKKPTLNIDRTTSTLTYVERADVMNKEAAIAAIPLIIKAFAGFHDAAAELKSGTIAGANFSREIGLHLQSWCGHEKMSIHFWKTHCEKVLPFDFEAAQFFMSVARKMKNKAKTLAETWEFSQLILIGDGLLPAPQRSESQSEAPIPPLQRLCCQFVMLRKPLQKIFNLAPMEQWKPTELELFLSETEWLAEEREKAQKLRQSK